MVPFMFLKMCGSNWLTRIVGVGVQFLLLLFLSYLGPAGLHIPNLALPPSRRVSPSPAEAAGANRPPKPTSSLLGDSPLGTESAGPVIKT